MPLAIYHNPSIWFGDNKNTNPSPTSDLFEEIIASRSFDTIDVSITRDGLFSFDFSRWSNDHSSLEERRKKQISIINTYLLCFYYAVAAKGSVLPNQRWVIPLMRADHGNLWGINPSRTGFGGPSSIDDIWRILGLRNMRADIPGMLTPWRLPERVLDTGFELFSVMWSNQNDNAFILADLLLSSHVAHYNVRFADALALAWLIIETLINEKWTNYLQNNRTREGKEFITGKRLDTLLSRDYTASIQIETLSLIGEISYEVYRKLTEVRKARNDWIHELKPVSQDKSSLSVQLAESFIRETLNFDATLPPHVAPFIGGGEYIDHEAASTNNRSVREISIPKEHIHVSSLDAELRAALKNRTSGLTRDSRSVRVQLFENATEADEELATEIVKAHSPAFLSIDDAHRFLPGEYEFDGQRLQNHIIGDGMDKLTIYVKVPYGNKNVVAIFVDSDQYAVALKEGVGTLEVTSNLPVGTIITVRVDGYASDPLHIEVLAP